MKREIEPIAIIETPFSSKFGIPRQSGLAETRGRIVFTKPYRNKEAVRGLEAYSHLWLIWDFSEAKCDGWSPTVRPPRLGGNTRVGVFATRSPFRPNSLGLSCVRMERISLKEPDAPVIYVLGADLLNGTPIFDIKPYLPFADAVPDAVGGFADHVKEQRLRVEIPAALQTMMAGDLSALTEILAQDPRPHYQDDPERVYRFEYGRRHIGFRVEKGTAIVVSVDVLP